MLFDCNIIQRHRDYPTLTYHLDDHLYVFCSLKEREAGEGERVLFFKASLLTEDRADAKEVDASRIQEIFDACFPSSAPTSTLSSSLIERVRDLLDRGYVIDDNGAFYPLPLFNPELSLVEEKINREIEFMLKQLGLTEYSIDIPPSSPSRLSEEQIAQINERFKGILCLNPPSSSSSAPSIKSLINLASWVIEDEKGEEKDKRKNKTRANSILSGSSPSHLVALQQANHVDEDHNRLQNEVIALWEEEPAIARLTCFIYARMYLARAITAFGVVKSTQIDIKNNDPHITDENKSLLKVKVAKGKKELFRSLAMLSLLKNRSTGMRDSLSRESWEILRLSQSFSEESLFLTTAREVLGQSAHRSIVDATFDSISSRERLLPARHDLHILRKLYDEAPIFPKAIGELSLWASLAPGHNSDSLLGLLETYHGYASLGSYAYGDRSNFSGRVFLVIDLIIAMGEELSLKEMKEVFDLIEKIGKVYVFNTKDQKRLSSYSERLSKTQGLLFKILEHLVGMEGRLIAQIDKVSGERQISSTHPAPSRASASKQSPRVEQTTKPVTGKGWGGHSAVSRVKVDSKTVTTSASHSPSASSASISRSSSSSGPSSSGGATSSGVTGSSIFGH